MIGTRRTRLAAAAGVVVVLAVVAEFTAPSGAAPEPESVPVVATELVCPNAPTTSDRSVHTQVSAVTPAQLVSGTNGRATVGTLTKPTAFATISGTTHAAVVNTPAGTSSVVGAAVAGRAPGFAMDELTVSEGRSSHGLSGLTCGEPDDDFWFVGTGSGVGHTATLHLTDAADTPATVDIALYGKNGRIDAPAALGLLVKANSHRVVHLDELAPGAGTLAVHVTASAGRVAAALFDAEVSGLQAEGADWLPVSEAPAKRAVVPGLGGGAGVRKLTIFAPGEGSATVDVRLVGRQGSFAPTGAASLEIDRGKVTTVDLGEAIAQDQSAAVVESSVPLVAGVRWSATAGAIDDLAFSAGSSALTAPAVVAGNHDADGYKSALMLTAPDGAARVSVQQLIAGVPSGAPKVVTVGADRTVRVALQVPGKGSFQTVVTPLEGSARVYAAVIRTHVVDRANGTTVSVVRNARVAVGVPQAAANLDVGLGR